MNRIKYLLLVLALTFPILQLYADEPFRKHRYNAFSVLPVGPDNIVMMGNSITNMHEWWEALGDHRIINRGVSGAVSDEMLENLGPIVSGHPAKVFIMIGTNDIGYNKSREHIAENLQKIITRFQQESPSTKLYVQSILPSGNGIRGGKIAGTNELLRTICRKADVTYIDLYDKLGDGEGHMKSGWSFDDLHPKAIGYRTWCDALIPYLDEGTNHTHTCVYTENLEDIHENRFDSFGARLGTMSQLPIEANDILFIGDEMIHSGEWHELLQTPKAKNRGTGWGYPGGDISWFMKEIPHLLHGNTTNACPQTIVLYAGAQEAENKLDIQAFESQYRELLTLLHREAPSAHIKILSILRNENKEKDQEFTQAFNKVLQKIAQKDKQATYIDIYTPLLSPDMMMGAYVSGQGYLKIAEQLNTL